VEIKIYSWKDLDTVITKSPLTIKPVQQLLITSAHHENTFGTMMPDSSMSPFFPKSSILIIEPSSHYDDRSFVLVHVKKINKFLFRQMLSDGENLFLKSLSSDLAEFPIRKLEADDIIIGCLVESRQTNFKSLEKEK
jgi:SOS-response transcriptional repressor LexA